jgi:hypothetical protein
MAASATTLTAPETTPPGFNSERACEKEVEKEKLKLINWFMVKK